MNSSGALIIHGLFSQPINGHLTGEAKEQWAPEVEKIADGLRTDELIEYALKQINRLIQCQDNSRPSRAAYLEQVRSALFESSVELEKLLLPPIQRTMVL